MLAAAKKRVPARNGKLDIGKLGKLALFSASPL
jgi:hypothetical protein